jgi:acetyl/propionyl-CoA carboxylase alpha subunit
MNTRLQVEHPISELISGLDLVKEQIKIARGEKISFSQEDLTINGHAIELRVYAEDPQNNFLPDIGTLIEYKKPEGLGIRVDDGFREGMEIPIYYDPMIAKLVVWGKNRTEAIERMKRAIDEYRIKGVKTTLPFGKFVLNHPNFISGDIDTHFVEKYYNSDLLNEKINEEEIKVISEFIAVKNKLIIEKNNTQTSKSNIEIRSSNWKKNRPQAV